MGKKLNKIFIVALVALLALSLLAFVGCDKLKDLGKPVIETGEKEATVIIGEDSYFVKTDAEYVHDLLVELKEAGEIEYDFDVTEYGAYIKKLGSLDPTKSQNSFIALYHDIDDDSLIDYEYGSTVKYDGKDFHSASVGASSMPVRSGAKYLFKLETF